MTDQPRPGPFGPDVVVVGSASRDIGAGGWRLGGSVSYCALTTARLGLRTAAIVGVDADAARAVEFGLLREAGVDMRFVRLASGPVFVNIERPDGRLQVCHRRSDPIPAADVPAGWLAAPGWILAPVAGELPDEWAAIPSTAATVAVGWQGFLRALVPGEPVVRIAPAPTPILLRADIVGVSRDDVDHGLPMGTLYQSLRQGATLVVTVGDRGGIVTDGFADGAPRFRYFPAVDSHGPVDPTGAGDVFLAALASARIRPRLVGGRIAQGFDLLLAASAASLVIEGPGLVGVPSRDAVRARMAEGLRAFRAGSRPGDATSGRRAGSGPDDTA